MKLVKWLLKQKDDKMKLIFIIFTSLVLLFALFLIVYDIIEIVNLQKYNTIPTDFMTINLWGIILAVIDLIYFITLLILSNRQIKSK